MKKNSQRILCVSLIVIALVAIMATVAPITAAGTFGSYSFSLVDGEATIDGYTGVGGAVTIPSSIEGYPVVSIGEDAFYGCTKLTGVTFPDSVTSIGESAFYGCSSLVSLSIPDTVTSLDNSVFADCTGLKQLALPRELTTLGRGVFSGCTGLTSVDIPQGTDSSGVYGTFEGCTGLKYVNIENRVTSLGDEVFANCTALIGVTMHEKLASIGTDAFSGCGKFTIFGDRGSFAREYAVNNDVPFVPFKDYAFALSDSGLTITDYLGGESDLQIPTTLDGYPVTGIGSGAFFEQYELSSVVIPSGVTSIAVSTWRYLDSNTQELVATGAFFECPNLKQITVAANNASYSSEDGVVFNKGKTTVVLCPEGKAGSYLIPTSVTVIGTSAFAGCSLTAITIPGGVTEIGDRGFSGCSGLTSVTIPSDVRTIGNNAFDSCMHLKAVTIPEHVTDIGNQAFFNCAELADVFFLGNAPHIGETVFENNDDNTLIHYMSGKSGFTNPWQGCKTTTSSKVTIADSTSGRSNVTLIVVVIGVAVAGLAVTLLLLKRRKTAAN